MRDADDPLEKEGEAEDIHGIAAAIREESVDQVTDKSYAVLSEEAEEPRHVEFEGSHAASASAQEMADAAEADDAEAVRVHACNYSSECSSVPEEAEEPRHVQFEGSHAASASAQEIVVAAEADDAEAADEVVTRHSSSPGRRRANTDAFMPRLSECPEEEPQTFVCKSYSESWPASSFADRGTIVSVESFLAEAEEIRSGRKAGLDPKLRSVREVREKDEAGKDRSRLGSWFSGLLSNGSRNVSRESSVASAAAAMQTRASAGSAASNSPRSPDLHSAIDDVDISISMRFHIFNMANAPELRSIETLQGSSGRGTLDSIFHGPLEDGSLPEVVFVALPEAPTSLPLDKWCTEHRLVQGRGASDQRQRPGVDKVAVASAQYESARDKSTRVAGLLEDLAGDYNGDLKTMLAFSSERFHEESSKNLFGLLKDITVGGIPVPNPKKSFIGRCIEERVITSRRLRFAFVGSHFPITDMTDILETEEPAQETLQVAKRVLAGVLRQVLRRAGKGGVVDEHTILFVQGDLNSRTMLCRGRAYDVLQEVLQDRQLQKSIAHNLPNLPPGRWHELVPHETAATLPMTYKFTHGKVEPAREEQDSPPSEPPLTLGAIMEEAARARSGPASETANVWTSEVDEHRPEDYRQTLMDVEALREHWNIAFKANAFKPFRFPASADRILYWAPDALQAKLVWHFPKGGYEVNHRQAGSDHKPVSLEAVLRISRLPIEVEELPFVRTISDGSDHITSLDTTASQKLSGFLPPERSASEGNLPQLLEPAVPRAQVDALGSDGTETQVPMVARQSRLARKGVGWNWTPNDEARVCEICDMGFTLFRRRHHCRICGICVCGTCSPAEDMRPLPELGIDEPCRICTHCDTDRDEQLSVMTRSVAARGRSSGSADSSTGRRLATCVSTDEMPLTTF